MSYIKRISERADRNLVSQGGKERSSNKAGVISATDIVADLKKLTDDLTGQQFTRIVDKMNTAVRSAAVKAARKASSASQIGESMKSKMTRGDWKNPPRVVKDGPNKGTEYLKGGWWGEVLKKRGAKKPSMANNGGKDGDTGMISKNSKGRNGRTRIGITGPRYGDDAKDNSRHGYNYAHVLEFGGEHKAWGKPSPALPARPFLGPAGKESMPKQIRIMKNELIKWGKG